MNDLENIHEGMQEEEERKKKAAAYFLKSLKEAGLGVETSSAPRKRIPKLIAEMKTCYNKGSSGMCRTRSETHELVEVIVNLEVELDNLLIIP